MPEDTSLPAETTLGLEDAPDDPRRSRRTSRRKPKIIPNDNEKRLILDHILKTMTDDMDARQEWMQMRLERYAKLRGWRGEKDFPWPNSSNAHIPMMQIDNLRTQDTLHNAILAVRPVINAKAVKRTDQPKEEVIDELIDYQVFVEQEGEEAFSLLIQKFVEDGRFTAFIPWIRETQNIHDMRVLPPLSNEEDDESTFRAMLESGIIIPNTVSVNKKDNDGYIWEIEFKDEDNISHTGRVEFYFQDNNKVEAHISMPVQTYNGPVLIPKSIEDVVAPWRCGNLQPPSAANPFGAPHVRLVDYPSLDEILRLQKNGTYDELSEDDIDRLKESSMIKPEVTSNEEEFKDQKDIMEGIEAGLSIDGKRAFKRIMAFDRYDVNNDGLEEDVIFWMIEEPKVMLRARMLTEMFPSNPPRRPLAESQLMPVGEDRLYGISLPEMMEPLHDILVTTTNQVIDNNTIANTPFFFFRPGTGMRNDVIRLAPGEGYPLNNPQQDAFFPPIQGKSQSEGFNLMTLMQQYNERLTMVSDLDLGRIPKGASSALRTASTTSAILQQGEARPERVLRRLFMGIQQIYEIIHAMNQRFLPGKKQIRIGGFVDPDVNPYREITDIEQIRAEMNFEFQASLTNTSPGALEQSLTKIAELVFSPISQAIGSADAEGMYNLQRDLVKVMKIDPDRYLKRPQNVDIDQQKITAEEALTIIFTDKKLPSGIPLETTQIHMDKLVEFTSSDEFGLFDNNDVNLLRQYMTGVQQRLQAEQEQFRRIQASIQARQGKGGSETLPPAGQNPTGPQNNQPVGANELLDETLPSAGGGANNA
jgi:hypothetical protein